MCSILINFEGIIVYVSESMCVVDRVWWYIYVIMNGYMSFVDVTVLSTFCEYMHEVARVLFSKLVWF